MSSVLTDNVLVLNKNWQAIDTMTVETAFCNLVRGVATSIDTEAMRPVTWDEWMKLPIREGDKFIRTIHGHVRVPTVIACVTFDRMPKKTPKLTAANIRKRDQSKCQYTGRLLKPDEGNLDHVIPESRNGKKSWENLVWCSKDVNQKKGDRTPEEVGLKLLRKPQAPREVPAIMLIERRPDKPDWDHFLIR